MAVDSFSLKATFMAVIIIIIIVLLSDFSEEKNRDSERGKRSITVIQLISGRSRSQIYVLMSPIPTPVILASSSPLLALPKGRKIRAVESILSHSARTASLLSVLPIGSLKKKFFLRPFCHKKSSENPSLRLPHFLKIFVIFFHFLETQNLVTTVVRNTGGFQGGLTMGKETGGRAVFFYLSYVTRVQTKRLRCPSLSLIFLA